MNPAVAMKPLALPPVKRPQTNRQTELHPESTPKYSSYSIPKDPIAKDSNGKYSSTVLQDSRTDYPATSTEDDSKTDDAEAYAATDLALICPPTPPPPPYKPLYTTLYSSNDARLASTATSLFSSLSSSDSFHETLASESDAGSDGSSVDTFIDVTSSFSSTSANTNNNNITINDIHITPPKSTNSSTKREWPYLNPPEHVYYPTNSDSVVSENPSPISLDEGEFTEKIQDDSGVSASSSKQVDEDDGPENSGLNGSF
jgi:hypothetical protein